MRVTLPVLMACLLALALPAGPVAANPFAAEALSWTGDGIFRRAIDAAPEGMRCRGQTEPTPEGFVLSGRCASAARSATLTLDASLSDGTARVSLSTSLLDAPLALTGVYTAEGLSAEAADPVVIDDTPTRFRVQLNYTAADRFVLTEFITPITTGARTELVQIQFER